MFAHNSDQGLAVAREITRSDPEFLGGWFAIANQTYQAILAHPDTAEPFRTEGLAAAERMIVLRPDAQEGYVYKALLSDPRRPVEREAMLRQTAAREPVFADVGSTLPGGFPRPGRPA